MKDINASLAADLLALQIKYDDLFSKHFRLLGKLVTLPRYSETTWTEGKFFHKTHSFSMENDPNGSWHMHGDIEDLLK